MLLGKNPTVKDGTWATVEESVLITRLPQRQALGGDKSGAGKNH